MAARKYEIAEAREVARKRSGNGVAPISVGLEVLRAASLLRDGLQGLRVERELGDDSEMEDDERKVTTPALDDRWCLKVEGREKGDRSGLGMMRTM